MRNICRSSVRVYGSESRLDAALPELAAQGLPVYDMKPELLKEADTYQLYYKYDTHWNPERLLYRQQQMHRLCLEPRHRSVQSRLRRQDRRPETWRGCLTWQQSTATIPNM